MRLAVPSCVVSSFRETFPNVFKDYTGFKETLENIIIIIIIFYSTQ